MHLQFKSSNLVLPSGPAALVVGHPGHELRVHGWMEGQLTHVFVLTDGSGRTDQERLFATRDLLENLPASELANFGGLPDRTFYQMLLNARLDVFRQLAEDLAAALIATGVQYVVGDAADGYNPAHDVCRLLINTAVTSIANRTGRRLANYEFLLVGDPQGQFGKSAGQAVHMRLSAEAFARKLAAARRYEQLRGEFDDAIMTVGLDAFGIECFRPTPQPILWFRRSKTPPNYEQHGERRAAEGSYRQIIRYRRHVEPLIAHLASWAEGPVACVA
jgi:hypothetical protein